MPSVPANDSNRIVLPQLYSNNMADYWDIAGFPRTIAGRFFTSETENLHVQIPAVLSFALPQTVQNGWFLAIGESKAFSIFIESRNSTKTIYRRRQKTLKGKKLQIECILHINENANTPTERNIIERCLKPFITGVSDSINIRIIFDGKTFEIREYPARLGKSLIFKGTL